MDPFQIFLEVCKAIAVVGAAVVYIYRAYKKTREPHDNLEKRIENIETDVSEIKKKIEANDKQTETNRENMGLIMRSMLNLIENKLTGNNIDGLKKTRDELLKALTE